MGSNRSSERTAITAAGFSDPITISSLGSCLLENLSVCDHGSEVDDIASTDECGRSGPPYALQQACQLRTGPVTVPLGVEETNEESLSRVNAPKDGLSDDLDGYSATDVPHQHTSSPFSVGGTYSLDLERANKHLKDQRYFLVFGQDGSATAYCWAVDAQASQISHTYRVEGGDKTVLHFCSTFNHSEPDVGLRARALGHEFYLPHVELRRLPANNGEYLPTLVCFDAQQALRVASQWNNRFAPTMDSEIEDRLTLELAQLLTQPADKGFSDERDVRLQLPKSFPSSFVPQPELPTLAWYALQTYDPLQVDQGDSSVGPPGHGMTNGLSGLEPVNPQETARVSISACPPYPEISTTLHDAPECLPNLGLSSDRWPKEQVMKIIGPGPDLPTIKRFAKDFSAKLKRRGLKVAYCQYCQDVNGKSVEECALRDLRPWNLERHLLAHYKVPKFTCTVCRKGTVTKQQLKEHIKKKHPNHRPNL